MNSINPLDSLVFEPQFGLYFEVRGGCTTGGVLHRFKPSGELIVPLVE